MNLNSLGGLREWFGTLEPPDPHALRGVYQAEFVGPAWLRRMAGPTLGMAGLKGWWGKVFDPDKKAENIVARGDALLRALPMELQERESQVDGRPGVVLTYPPGSPFPWRWVVDELRQAGERQLLGLSMVNVGPLRNLTFPFLLHRREDVDGL
jgi:hypothetical protein